jgi:hypothetical protein
MTRWLRASAPVIVSALLLVLAGCGSKMKTVVETTYSVPTTSNSGQNYGDTTSSTTTSAASTQSAPAGPLTPHQAAITVEFSGFRYQIEYTGVSILQPSGGVTSAQPGYTLPFAQIRVTNLQTDRPVPYGQGSFVNQFLEFYALRKVIHPPVICERHILQFCADAGGSELSDNGGQPGETLDGSEIDTLDAGGQDTVWIVGGQVKESTQRGDLAIVNEPGFQIGGTQRQPAILAR